MEARSYVTTSLLDGWQSGRKDCEKESQFKRNREIKIDTGAAPARESEMTGECASYVHRNFLLDPLFVIYHPRMGDSAYTQTELVLGNIERPTVFFVRSRLIYHQ